MNKTCVVCGIAVAVVAMFGPEAQPFICKNCERKEIDPHTHEQPQVRNPIMNFNVVRVSGATGSIMTQTSIGVKADYLFKQLNELRKLNE